MQVCIPLIYICCIRVLLALHDWYVFYLRPVLLLLGIATTYPIKHQYNRRSVARSCYAEFCQKSKYIDEHPSKPHFVSPRVLHFPGIPNNLELHISLCGAIHCLHVLAIQLMGDKLTVNTLQIHHQQQLARFTQHHACSSESTTPCTNNTTSALAMPPIHAGGFPPAPPQTERRYASVESGGGGGGDGGGRRFPDRSVSSCHSRSLSARRSGPSEARLVIWSLCSLSLQAAGAERVGCRARACYVKPTVARVPVIRLLLALTHRHAYLHACGY